MRFSIIITSTRPHLLRYSLRSALAQDFADYEVVVSDNSESGCRDFVESMGDSRVRYLRPESPMSLTQHWNFAFAQARADYHLQLCDDDAIVPNLLSTLHDQIGFYPDVESISWNYGSFRGNLCRDGKSVFNQLGVNHFSGKATLYHSAQLLAEMFNSGTGLFRIKSKIPFFPRSVCRSDVLDAVRARQGCLFHPFCPMTSGAAAILSFTKRTLHIDLPLMLIGATIDSCGGWLTDPTTMDASHASTSVEFAPIKLLRVLPTAMTDALIRTQRAMPERLSQYEINHGNYFLHCHLFLCEAEENGFDASECRASFDEALARMPIKLQAAVRRAIAEEPKSSSPSLFLRAKQVAALLYKQMKAPQLPGEVDAAALGLRDIFECATYVGGLINGHKGFADQGLRR